MNIAGTPEIFQSVMIDLFRALEHNFVYIDDILITQKVDKVKVNYMKKIEEVLGKLEANGFQPNLQKSFFM